MRITLAAICAIILTACGSDSDDSPATVAEPVWESTEARTLLVNNCAVSGCHNGTQSPNYSTMSQATFVSSQSNAITRMKSTTSPMPPSPRDPLDEASIAIFEALFE
ncbi:MAG: hypothetical protein HRU19_18335 [Pseudobacteriovorax sp.]|nr:hypothetical protein [Pseudobacteriovorax sp.]